MNETRSTIQATIRRAAAGDAAAIDNLYRELVSKAPIQVLPEQVASLSESLTSFLLVAEFQGEVCGTALFTICPDAMFRTQPFGVIENVIVTEARRGNGIGRLLLSHVEHLALSLHCTKLMLLSSATREEAHAFFRNCGFRSDSKQAFVKYRRQFSADC